MNPFSHTSVLNDITMARFCTFSNIVSQKGVVDLGTLSVLAHLKLREGDPPVRPS